MAAVEQIRGVSFNWNQEGSTSDFTNDGQIGFIAQEVDTIFPQLTSINNNGYYSVGYNRLTPILVEAIKELKEKNENLKSRLNELKKKAMILLNNQE